MTAIPSFQCKAQQQLAPTPAALPLPPCVHARLSIGLDQAYCPDCRCGFKPKTPEYKSAIALPPPGVTKNGSGVPATCDSLFSEDSPENPTPEPKTVVAAILHWVETYPTKKGLHHYYRYRWLDEPDNICSGGHRHICGGNIRSAVALARKAEIESAIALGQSPRQILHLIKSWKATNDPR